LKPESDGGFGIKSNRTILASDIDAMPDGIQVLITRFACATYELAKPQTIHRTVS
jgi:hypothetical protein